MLTGIAFFINMNQKLSELSIFPEVFSLIVRNYIFFLSPDKATPKL